MFICACCTEAWMAYLSWVVFALLVSTFMGGPCGYYIGYVKGIWSVPILFSILIVFVTFQFFMATFMDPGVYPRATTAERASYGPKPAVWQHVKINKTNIALKYCYTCHFYRPPRCTHCSRCDACVCVFDHHCQAKHLMKSFIFAFC